MSGKELAVSAITPAEHARMRDKVKPMWPMFENAVGIDLAQEVFAELNKRVSKDTASSA